MSRRRWGRFVALAVALIMVGTIRSFVPDYLPGESTRGPGTDGVAVTQRFTAELTDAVVTRSIHLPLVEGTVETDDVLVVVRLQIRPTRERIFAEFRIDARDGTTYSALRQRIGGDASAGGATMYPATQTTISMAIEIPESKLDGAQLVVSASNIGRIEPMRPVARFSLDDLGEPLSEFTPEPDVVELIDDQA